MIWQISCLTGLKPYCKDDDDVRGDHETEKEELVIVKSTYRVSVEALIRCTLPHDPLGMRKIWRNNTFNEELSKHKNQHICKVRPVYSAHLGLLIHELEGNNIKEETMVLFKLYISGQLDCHRSTPPFPIRAWGQRHLVTGFDIKFWWYQHLLNKPWTHYGYTLSVSLQNVSWIHEQNLPIPHGPHGFFSTCRV